jgi:hypothetical protein
VATTFDYCQDIRLQLPDEAKRFERIDKTFKKIMSDTAKNTLVLEVSRDIVIFYMNININVDETGLIVV